MNETYTLEPIGYMNTCFPEKFGIPRQPLLAPSAKGVLRLLPPFNDPACVRGLEKSSHVWLSFIFHQHTDQGWKPTVRPPRLGGNEKQGVFATRSSFRPNSLGLSVVALDKVCVDNQQVVLHFSGVDLLDGTPIVDIKPYLSYVDSLPHAVNTLAQQAPEIMPVVFSASAELFCKTYGDEVSSAIGPVSNLKQLIIDVLQQDPRPAYHQQAVSDAAREYGIALLDCNIRWECMDDKSGGQKKIVRVNSISRC
ncbi:tRNA (N6-threonylcarbamoyladenosine(37)-N6)-methyltransferase TrmO [Eionea flava]